MKQTLLILLGCSTMLWADFSRSGDIVTDDNSGLQWQDDTLAKTNMLGWQNAISYCEDLALGGYDDWRLLNITELTSLVDDTKYYPGMDTAFHNGVSNGYWSSTTDAYYSSSAWIVNFDYGSQNYNGKGNGYYVRCIRAGQ